MTATAEEETTRQRAEWGAAMADLHNAAAALAQHARALGKLTLRANVTQVQLADACAQVHAARARVLAAEERVDIAARDLAGAVGEDL